MEEFEDVDTSAWPIHQRWRVINACLAAGILTLSEVADGFHLELPKVDAAFLEVPEAQSEGSIA